MRKTRMMVTTRYDVSSVGFLINQDRRSVFSMEYSCTRLYQGLHYICIDRNNDDVEVDFFYNTSVVYTRYCCYLYRDNHHDPSL